MKMRTTAAVLGFVLGLGLAPVHAQTEDAEWVWVEGEPSADQDAYFVRLFLVEGEVARAPLLATCDNHMTVYINGVEVAQSSTWESPTRVDVAQHLREGRNSVAVACRNDAGPAGLALRLEVIAPDGSRQRVVTSADWRVGEDAPEGWNEPGFNIRNWDRATSLGSTSDASFPWGAVMTVREATPGAEIQLPEGFVAELVHSAQPGEGSWVSLILDDQGRALIGPESGGLLRLTRTGPEQADVERLSVDIGMCQGLLFAHDALYASVAENANRQGGLHRLRDTDGDDQFETHDFLAAYPNRSEHGPHGLALGPDGMIYTVHGNYTPLPENLDTENSPYRNWAEDTLLPRLWDPRGHAVNIMSPAGRVLRTDKDGARWEIVAGGMRNAYDIAFAPNGELFTYDSDMEWDIGLPWYRPPRVLHVVPGGEYGWRSGTAKWPDWYPDSLPAVVETDLSSPVGVAFAQRGMFPEPWASAFFVGDWAYGRIAAVHLAPDGASWTGEYETFALGLPLSITDITFGADGAMWFTTGGRGTQSGLYRVTYEGDEPAGKAPVIHALTDQMRLRREIEAEPGLTQDKSNAITSDDRFIRFAARLAGERDTDPLSTLNASSGAQGAPVEALLVEARRAEPSRGSKGPIGLALIHLSPEDPPEVIASALRTVQVAIARGGLPEDPARQMLLDVLGSVFPARDERINRVAGELLVALDAPQIGARLLGVLGSSETLETQIHAALILRLVAHQLSPEELDRYFRWLHQTRSVVGGGMSFEGYIRAIEREALERVDEAPRERLAALMAQLDESDAKPQAPSRPIVQQWNVDGALRAVDGAGGRRSLQRGKHLYTAARCIECHRFDGAGGATGPDLTGVARRFSNRDLIEAIVDPSAVVSDQYRASVVTLHDGRTFTGRLLQITGGRMHVLTDPYSHHADRIDPTEIESVEPSPVSTMPPALLDTLTAAEVADLIAYLQSGAQGS